MTKQPVNPLPLKRVHSESTEKHRRRLTTAGPRSSGTDSVAPRWGSADRTATASGAEHLPAAAEPGSTLPSSTAWGGSRERGRDV